ncbi:zinc finger protein 189-like isoform X2 [Bufo bufo]|uniref:zinc finger protein 189-like isoform X2 n=1 Tax=Bufo bufo TaxID=8384 RepID=UPI001ABE3240|nr:zinc finger protein 189-like isoform X2 [Bufo bufo]
MRVELQSPDAARRLLHVLTRGSGSRGGGGSVASADFRASCSRLQTSEGLHTVVAQGPGVLMEKCTKSAASDVKRTPPAAMEETMKPEEATVCFSVEELDSLEDREKERYKSAETKIHQRPNLVGYLYVKPETVPKIHRGEELCVSSDLYTHRRKRSVLPSSGEPLGKDDGCHSPSQSTADTRRALSRVRRKQGRYTAGLAEGSRPSKTESKADTEGLPSNNDDNTDTVETKSDPAPKEYTCSECGDCFEEQAALLVHKAAHTEENNSTKHDRSLTPTRHHGVQTGEHTGSRLRHRKHVSYTPDKMVSKRTRAEPKTYTCKECGKSFTQNASLIVHRRTHTGEKPHTCKICLKSFISGSYLVMHQRVHTGEKPYVCSDCGKRFISSSNLIIHQRVHTGEKPYLCTECGKCFGHSSHLVRHQKVHTGERPFTCAECGKSFSRSSHLVRHQTIHMRGPANPAV